MDSRTGQVLLHNISDSMSRSDWTDGSEMAQEHLGYGNARAPSEQIIGDGGPHLLGQWQSPFAPVLGFSQPNLGRSPEDIRNLQEAYFLVPQTEHSDDKQHGFIPQAFRFAGIDAFD